MRKRGKFQSSPICLKLTAKKQKFSNYLEIFDDQKLFTMTYDDKIVVNMPSSLEKQLDILISDLFSAD